MSVSAISSNAHNPPVARPASAPPPAAPAKADKPNDGDSDDGVKTVAAGAPAKSSSAVQSALSALKVGG